MLNKKIKLLRLVTQAEVVKWHLKNFIDRSELDFDLYIAGNNVSKYKDEFKHVTFIDINIERKINLYKDIIALFSFLIICVKIRPQIIHSIMPKAGIIASIAGFITFVPIRIHTFTGQIWIDFYGIKRFVFIYLDKIINYLNTINLTDSASQSKFLFNNGIKYKGGCIPFLGNGSLSGVDLKKFNYDKLIPRKMEIKSKLNISKNIFTILYLARKSKVKGIGYLYDVIDKIQDLNFCLIFIGPDESDGYLDYLKSRYSYLNKKIIYLDSVDNAEEYIIASDIFCLPSSMEGFGSIVIEAASLGVPTVGFDIIGLSDSIEKDTTGVLVDKFNTITLAEELRKLYNDKLYLKSLSINCINRVHKQFDADLLYKLHLEFYIRFTKKLSPKH